MSSAKGKCNSTQQDIRRDNPDFRVQDPCPVCDIKIGYHENLPPPVPAGNFTRELEQIHIQLRELHISQKPVGISTAAQWVASLRQKGVLRTNTSSLSSFLEIRAVNWWPTPTVAPFPTVDSMETTTCQPFVSSIIANILDSEGQVYEKDKRFQVSTYCKTTTHVVFNSQPCDGHAAASFSNRKPDIVCYHGERRGGSNITAIGDVKGCRAQHKDFPEEEVGHILDMGVDLMKKEQFSRTVLYCFLTDGYRFQYFRCSRNKQGDDFSFEQSPVYGGERGWQIFFGLLTSPVEDLGFVSLDVPGWQIESGLGKGRFSSVYSCHRSRTDEVCVMKVFRAETTHLAMTEKSILTELNGINVENIPVFRDLYSRSGDLTALVVTPVGTPVLPCSIHNKVSPGMIVAILHVIRKAHGLGWIHRDIKPDNIYFDSFNPRRIILNDWSSAVKAGIECDYIGTIIFGDPPNIRGKHVPTSILDLRSLARTAFCLSKQHRPLVDDDFDAVAQYWNEVKRDYSLFAIAMDLADAGDYDALEIFFRTSWL